MTALKAKTALIPKYEKLLDFVMRAGFDACDFVLMGSAALAVRGIRDVNDLDVLIKPALWGKVRELHGEGFWPGDTPEALPPTDYTPDLDADGTPREVLRTGQHDFFDAPMRIVGAVPTKIVFKDAQVFDGVQVVSLRHCLAIKALANRWKDRRDMVALAGLIAAEEVALEKDQDTP